MIYYNYRSAPTSIKKAILLKINYLSISLVDKNWNCDLSGWLESELPTKAMPAQRGKHHCLQITEEGFQTKWTKLASFANPVKRTPQCPERAFFTLPRFMVQTSRFCLCEFRNNSKCSCCSNFKTIKHAFSYIWFI